LGDSGHRRLLAGYVCFDVGDGPGGQDESISCTSFLVFTLVYIGYVLVHNAPIFGTRATWSSRPGYMVHKTACSGAKQVFAAENHCRPELLPLLLRVRLKEQDYASTCAK
jgi:hypothetical protein